MNSSLKARKKRKRRKMWNRFGMALEGLSQLCHARKIESVKRKRRREEEGRERLRRIAKEEEDDDRKREGREWLSPKKMKSRGTENEPKLER